MHDRSTCKEHCHNAEKYWDKITQRLLIETLFAPNEYEGYDLDRLSRNGHEKLGDFNQIDDILKENNREKVIKTIECGGTTYEILNPNYALNRVLSYHVDDNFVLQPVFFSANKITIKNNKKSTSEVFEPFLLFNDGTTKTVFQIDIIFECNGKRNKIKKIPEDLDSMFTHAGAMRFLDGETVNGEDIWNDVKEYWDTYADFDQPDKLILLTAYTIGTFFYYCYNAFPYLKLGGIKGSGKTQCGEIGKRLSFHGELDSKITTSSIYRIESSGMTLWYDEAESLNNSKNDPDLISALNSGYKKGSKYRLRNKDTHAPETYEAYCPKAFMCINELHNVLQSRCIEVIMLRTVTDKGDLKFDEATAQEIRDDLYLLRLQDSCEVFKNTNNNESLKDIKLSNRNRELFKPLLDITLRYGSESELTELKKWILNYLTTQSNDEIDSNEAEVYSALRKIFLENQKIDNNEIQYILISDIRTEILMRYPETYNNNKGMIRESSMFAKRLSSQRIGYLLKNMGFKEKKHLGSGISRKITLNQINDLKRRYSEFGGE
jgi:hypothetical protein